MATSQGTILVPLDGLDLAEQAIPFAQLIGGPDAAFILVQVVPKPEPLKGPFGRVIVGADEVRAMSEEAASSDLEQASERWFEPDAQARVRREVAYGDPAEEILRLTEEQNVALIVLASHGRGVVGRLTFGSVADRIVRTSTVPVMVIRPTDARAELGPVDIHRLIVPLDGSALAQQAVPVAADLAKRMNRPVVVLRAISPLPLTVPSSPIAGGLAASDSLYQEMFTEITEEARQTVDAAVDWLKSADVEAEALIVEGAPVTAISEVATQRDVIVLTSHGHSGIRRWMLGSVAEKLVRSGPGPVLLVPNLERASVASERDTQGGIAPERVRDLLWRDHYTPQEAAYLLGIDDAVICQAAYRGDLKARIVNHNIISIRQDDLLYWLKHR